MKDTGLNNIDPNALPNALKSLPEDKEECINSFLLSEYNQAWEAHRHLENLRTRYLAFLFTVSFAGTAVIGSIINKIQSNSIEAFLLGLFVSILSAYMIRVVGNLINSMKAIFPHHENVWKGIRIHFCDGKVEQILNIRNNEEVKNRPQKFGDSLENISNFFFWSFVFISVGLASIIFYQFIFPWLNDITTKIVENCT
jgi:hypothetical protein